ncbi:uncharacterized protein LOC112680724 [Sipha flava]|uniref:Uncharacterized protein LOC112680724 n=1 Tax=Sipha flava TaxID=143950 RepID=A0A2S2QEI0_9HEMI|nr:uncharacterized protein LOC112680724 [Sipha flava]
MNVDHGTRGLVVLLVLACAVVHTSCENVAFDVPNSTGYKANSAINARNGQQSDSELEKMLLNVASIIQKCIDNRTMNNKKFKKNLDKLYDRMVKPNIKRVIKENMLRYNNIKDLYEEKQLMLIIMNGDKTDKKIQ